MKTKLAALVVLTVAPLVWASASVAAPDDAPALELSAHMRGFLKQEMAALAKAGRMIEPALAEGDSATVAKFAAQMDKAFIFEAEVTTFDLRELEAVLGAEFVVRDKAFHAMGRNLEAAAKAGDIAAERQIFAKMLQVCAACHIAYAPEAPVLE